MDNNQFNQNNGQPMQQSFNPNIQPVQQNFDPNMQPMQQEYNPQFNQNFAYIQNADTNNNINYNPNYSANNNVNNNAPAKKHTGVIIAVIVSVIIIAAAIVVLVIVLNKKKDKDSSDDTRDTSTTVTATTSETETTTATTTEETPAEPVPYAEENGLTNWTDPYEEFDLQAYTFADFEDYSVVPESIVTPIQNMAHYKVLDISKSEPDEDGYVTYNFEYEITLTEQFIHYPENDDTERQIYVNSNPSYFFPCDYYTGVNFNVPEWDHDTYNYKDEYAYTTIDWGDEPFDAGLKVSVEYLYGDDGDSYYDLVGERDGGDLYQIVEKSTLTYSIYVPADYDGLLMGNYYDGITENYNIRDITNVADSYYIFGPNQFGDTFKPEDLFFVRVDDYVK